MVRYPSKPSPHTSPLIAATGLRPARTTFLIFLVGLRRLLRSEGTFHIVLFRHAGSCLREFYKNPLIGIVTVDGTRSKKVNTIELASKIDRNFEDAGCRERLLYWCPPAGSAGNSVVHSLSVTLSNHTILGNPPYNDPCPKDHPGYDRQTWPIGWPTRR